MTRKKYISDTMTKEFLLTVTVSVLASQLPILITPLLAGNFLSGSAIAAVTLCAPLWELCNGLCFLLVVGASYLSTEFICVNDTVNLNKHFTVSTISSLVATTAAAVAIFLFSKPISTFLCNGEIELTDLTNKYLPAMAMTFVPFCLFDILSCHFQSVGLTKMTLWCSVAVCIINITITLVFLTCSDFGITSFPLASIISMLAGSAFFLASMRKKSPYRFVNVSKDFWKILKINVDKGLPLLIDDLLYIIFFMLCNLIIVWSTGSDGPIIWGVANTFISLSTVIYTIISTSMTTLGEECCSTNDYNGCSLIIKRHRLIIFLATTVFFAIVELFPGFIMRLFGEPGLTDQQSLTHLRLATLVMLRMSILLFEPVIYYVTGKSRKYLFNILLFYLCPIGILFLFGLIDFELVWWGFLASTVGCILSASLIRKDTDKQLNKLHKGTISIDMSVSYDMSSVEPALASIRSFLSEHGTDTGTINAMEHCVDELSYNLIKHARASLSKHSFDIRAVKVGDAIIVLFKYGGQPFNPILEFSDTAEESARKGEKTQIALRLFNHYAKSPWYHYGYGINTLSMTISLEG